MISLPDVQTATVISDYFRAHFNVAPIFVFHAVGALQIILWWWWTNRFFQCQSSVA